MAAWAYLIEAHGIAGNLNESIKLLTYLKNKLKGSQVLVDGCVYEAMIKAFGVNQQTESAINMYNKYFQNSPTLTSFDAIIESVINCNEYEKVEEYWHSLLDFCNAQNSRIFGNGYGQKISVETFVKFRKIEHLKPVYKLKSNTFPTKYVPLQKTLHRMIEYYSKNKKLDDVQLLFRYHASVCAPCMDTYEVVMWALLERGTPEDHREALQIWRYFIINGFLSSEKLANTMWNLRKKYRLGLYSQPFPREQSMHKII